MRQYLSEPESASGEEICSSSCKSGRLTPKLVAKLIAHMKPPLETPSRRKTPGFYELQVPGIDKEPDVTYYVQLPPEYDPYRRYPASSR